jgi:hypothetical protein
MLNPLLLLIESRAGCISGDALGPAEAVSDITPVTTILAPLVAVALEILAAARAAHVVNGLFIDQMPVFFPPFYPAAITAKPFVLILGNVRQRLAAVLAEPAAYVFTAAKRFYCVGR